MQLMLLGLVSLLAFQKVGQESDFCLDNKPQVIFDYPGKSLRYGEQVELISWSGKTVVAVTRRDIPRSVVRIRGILVKAEPTTPKDLLGEAAYTYLLFKRECAEKQ